MQTDTQTPIEQNLDSEKLDNKNLNSKNTESKEDKFIQYILTICEQNRGVAARLTRADNPNTEYQSWEQLGPWIDLNNSYQRLPYASVAAAIARSKTRINGELGLGKALALAYAGQASSDSSDQAKARLRRLVACADIIEVCRVLRPILTLITSKVSQPLDYARLLRELIYFSERTKLNWAQDFYGQRVIDTQANQQQEDK